MTIDTPKTTGIVINRLAKSDYTHRLLNTVYEICACMALFLGHEFVAWFWKQADKQLGDMLFGKNGYNVEACHRFAEDAKQKSGISKASHWSCITEG